MKAIDHTNYEEWLFEYFEGSLSKEKKNEILNFIQRDPMLQEEFSYWEKTYIREPLPSKLRIEEALLKKVPSNRYVKYFALAVFLLAGTSYYFYNLKYAPLKTQKVDIKETKKPTAAEGIVNSKKINTKVKEGKEKIVIEKSIQESYIPAISINEPAVPEEEIRQATQPSVESVSNETIDNTTIPAALPDSGYTKKSDPISSIGSSKKSSSKESRKTQRAIEKHKRRMIEKREAEEFLKGNKPYVVPLDPNAF